jgi:hypothetical protein
MKPLSDKPVITVLQATTRENTNGILDGYQKLDVLVQGATLVDGPIVVLEKQLVISSNG